MSMASELFSQANAEFVDENYEKALNLYSKAIEIESEKDDYYSSRSHAYIKLERYQEAAADADKALSLNNKSTKAYLRKGIALYHMKNFEKAKQVFIDGQVRDSDDGNFIIWIQKCDSELGLAQNLETITQKNANQNSDLETEMKDKSKEKSGISESKGKTAAAESQKNDATSDSSVKPLPMPVKKIYDWYQTGTHVIITVLQKNVKSEDLSIDMHEHSVSVTIKQLSGSEFSLELDLAHPIVPEQSSYKVMSTKVEIKLKKQEGIQWTKLEGDGQQKSSIKSFCTSSQVSDVMKYPSSSQHTKNWDKVAHDVAEEEKNEKPEGDAALNQLFQKIYADASEDTKRAMVKSFYESGGTVLSTNWNEIGSKTTEVKPPDGMEFKKWQV